MKTIFIFLLVIPIFATSQKCKNIDRYILENDADYETVVEKNYAKSIKKYLLISNDYDVGYLNHTIADLYFKFKKKKKAIRFLENALSWGNDINDFDKSIYQNLSTEDSLRLTKKAPKLRSNFFKNIDYTLYKNTLYWYNTDQYLAKENILGSRKAQHPIRKQVFKNNLSLLREYITEKNNGFLPQFSQLGSEVMSIKVMLLHHTREDSIDTVNYLFFERKLREELCNGNTYGPTNYAQFVDNMQLIVDRGEKQIYGYHINWKKKQIYPLKYPEKVDSLRASIGLTDLKRYAKIRNVKLPENYSAK